VSAQIFDSKIMQKWKNLGFETKEIFGNELNLKKQFVERNESSSGKFEQVSNDYQNLVTSLRAITKEKENESLSSYIESEMVKKAKQMDTIFGKFDKNKKQRHEVSLKQIEDILKKVFPDQGLIERKENLLGLLQNQNPFY